MIPNQKSKGLVALFIVLSILLPCLLHAQGRPQFASNRYFVGMRSEVQTNAVETFTRVGAKVKRQFPRIRAMSIEASPAAAEALKHNPNVAYVEAEPMRYPTSLATTEIQPSFYNGLYGLLNTHALDAQLAGYSGFGIKVGIADTGIDYTHPDLASRYLGGIDIVSSDSDPWWNGSPDETHATHVAGIVLGNHNSSGIFGAAYDATLYHARVLGPNGGTTSDVMAGVQWLVQTAHCKVVNLSLGGGGSSITEQNFFADMRNQGALIVCAAGNDSAGTLSYPAAYPTNLSVGAVDRTNAHASFSNIGTNLDVSAPGVAILSSVPAGMGFETQIESPGQTIGAAQMTYSGLTSGINRVLVNCGRGNTGQFPLSVSGNIALIQRGDISFAQKVTNAMDAGALGAIIYNNVAGDFAGTLGTATTSDGRAWIPSVSVSDGAGTVLLGLAGSSVNLVNQVSSWDTYDGTSMATPYVTGAIAQLWSKDPTATNDQVETALKSTCQDLGSAGYDTTFGYGLINVSAALSALGSPPPPPPPLPSLSVTLVSSKASIKLGTSVSLTTTVKSGTAKVANANVTVTITAPNGAQYQSSGKTNSVGQYVVKFTTRKADGPGTYNVNSAATKSGYTGGSAATSFVAN